MWDMGMRIPDEDVARGIPQLGPEDADDDVNISGP
jgi:hypothetical protein